MPSSGFNGNSMHAMYTQTKYLKRHKEYIFQKKKKRKEEVGGSILKNKQEKKVANGGTGTGHSPTVPLCVSLPVVTLRPRAD